MWERGEVEPHRRAAAKDVLIRLVVGDIAADVVLAGERLDARLEVVRASHVRQGDAGGVLTLLAMIAVCRA